MGSKTTLRIVREIFIYIQNIHFLIVSTGGKATDFLCDK